MCDQGPAPGDTFGILTGLQLRKGVLGTMLFLIASSLSGNSRFVERVDSLEWTVWESDLIVLGYPVSVMPETVPNNAVLEEQTTLGVKSVLYGKYNAAPLMFQSKTTTTGTSMRFEVELARTENVTYNDRPQVFFLRRSDKRQPDDSEQWTLLRRVFPRQSSQGLETADGGLVRTAGEIMNVIEHEIAQRAILASPGNVAPSSTNFSRAETLSQGCFECIAPIGAVMLKLANKYVVAPAYPRFQADAFALLGSTDFRERERGALMLRSYPSEATTRALLLLLTDSGAYRWNLSSTTECTTFSVRAAAYDILHEQGIEVTKPLLDECHSR